MKKQIIINKVVNVLGYVYLAMAVSSIVWTIKTLVELI